MNKHFIVIGVCLVLISMPALCAFPTNQKTLPHPPLQGHDGTFIGGVGRMHRGNGGWQYDTSGYLAGVYDKLGGIKKINGYIYNLNEEQTGSIFAYFVYKTIIGYIENMEGSRAPVIGFLMWNNQNFAGRIMSLFGPASHIWGQYIPNV